MKRARSFTAWISSFTFCCCCVNPFALQGPVVVPQPVVVHVPQPGPEQPKTKKKTEKAGGETKVTRANFDLIQNGMTIAQVEAILGPGEEFGTNPGLEQRNFLWRNLNVAPPTTINIVFRNGVVLLKTMAP